MSTLLLKDVEFLLQPLCASERSRFAIDRPWVRDGYAYATNGRLLARVAVCDPDTPADRDTKYPAAAEFFGRADADGELVALPLVGAERRRKCQSCDGRGWMVCHACANEHACSACGGTSYDETAPPPVRVGPAFVDPRYVRALQLSGVTHVRPHRRTPRTEPLLGVGAMGVEILVMPVNVPEESPR